MAAATSGSRPDLIGEICILKEAIVARMMIRDRRKRRREDAMVSETLGPPGHSGGPIEVSADARMLLADSYKQSDFSY